MSTYASPSYGQRLGGPAPPTYDAPPRPLQAPQDAAALAALTRSVGTLSTSDGGSSTVPQWEKREWLRILNDELLPKSSKPEALQSLETLVKLIDGVAALPSTSDGTEKQRTIRLRNEKIKDNVVDVPGALDLLIKSGFRRRVLDFEEKLHFPLLPSSSDNAALLSRLSTGRAVLHEALSQAQQADELERTRKDAAEAETSRRMTEVLEGIKEDREMVKKRDERERAARRRAREAKEIQEKAVREAQAWDRA
ncbi:hypothetical protein JCM10207_008515 [Rhodosporidiobolus poonsookiae]